MAPLPTVVIGMHRSGTSAVAACLSKLGLDAPREDEQIHEIDNPAHLEPRRIARHNDDLLNARGGAWAYPTDDLRQQPGWAKQAQFLLGDVFPSNQWMLKDPRLCLLLEEWTFLPPEARFVLVSRDPSAVARSLAKRNRLTIPHGLALWDIYNYEAERQLQGRPVYCVTFEQIRAEPRRHLEALSRFLGLTQLDDHANRLTEAEGALDPGLGKERTRADGVAVVMERWEHLQALTGHHEIFRTEPEPVSVWSRTLIDAVRETGIGSPSLGDRRRRDLVGRAKRSWKRRRRLAS